MSLVDPAGTGKTLPKKEKSSGTIKLKKAIAKNTKPKDDGELCHSTGHHDTCILTTKPDSKAGTRSTSPDSPSVNGNETDPRASIPTSQTGDDNTQKVRCKHCKTALPKSAMASHTKICPEKNNKEKAPKKKDIKDRPTKPAAGNEDKDGDVPGEDSPATKPNGVEKGSTADGISSAKGVAKSAKKSAVKEATTTNETSKKSKKRKADGEGDKEPKKKKLKKDEPPKPKVPKPKGPVDVEKQCGVLLPNGGYCARSLTCKSHSMGSKRAVPGRSLPYDTLLNQYQKRNQAKQQKAAMDANAPLADDHDDPNNPVDSDEEKEQVMAAIARSRPQPLVQHVHVSLREKHRRIRIKDALFQALTGNRGGNLFAIKPLENQGQVAAGGGGGGSIVDGGNVVASPIGLGIGGSGTVAPPGEGSGNHGVGGSERRPSLIQRALSTANASANAAAAAAAAAAGASDGVVEKAGANQGGIQSRKSSTAALGIAAT
ncbi:MAG: hypothetical protein LQ350_002174 [Teloschistes chrysophthalmus]|nr:MAG: hypothetical protein LQ350_002174 [Niorma chrysophthalma]